MRSDDDDDDDYDESKTKKKKEEEVRGRINLHEFLPINLKNIDSFVIKRKPFLLPRFINVKVS